MLYKAMQQNKNESQTKHSQAEILKCFTAKERGKNYSFKNRNILSEVIQIY